MSNYNLAIDLLPIATINRTSAQMIRSSVHEGAADPKRDVTRLDSMYCVFPKMVMGERNRHRGFSLSDRSSRAVPPEKLIEEIRSGIGLAMPAKFRHRAKGMGGGEELTGDELIAAQVRWIRDAIDAADAAERAMNAGEEKETVNRRLDMYIYMHTLQTGVRDIWYNWFGLRLANASPTIELFAAKTFEVYKATTSTPLKPGGWHLPFIDSNDEGFVEFSAARSAHLSYNDLATGKLMTPGRAMDISASLRDSRPLHASPFEHQATPDTLHYNNHLAGTWRNPYEHGNLPGWRQARKMIPGEAVAQLPKGWEL